ncbi:MAG TPA: argininosuccinate lyase [Bryobacteraceae bacterium]|nr:argininosuccinate lyase [Bryobacteraceae bacterium]
MLETLHNIDHSFPAPAYARTVLAVNFEDAKRYFLESLLDIQYAHGLMLRQRGLLSAEEAAVIFRALNSLNRDALRSAQYSGTCEDLFFHVEDLLAGDIGVDVAGKLHTARSRNDIDITLYRMEIRKRLLTAVDEVLGLARVLCRIAADHLDTVMPAHTHTQPAQPTTLAHYLAAVIEMLLRDVARLQSAFATVNRNPLGACAITTTGFPIDRDATTELLGFDGIQLNSYGCIAAVDYVLESMAAISVAAVGAGKFIHDLLLWSMQEFGYLRLSNAFVQTSSIMPQKRNPVALEHARVLASRAHAEAQSVFTTAHNTPFGDIVDSEDDLMPLVFLAFEDASRTVQLVSAALETATFDCDLMKRRAGASFLTVTELADTLVRTEGLSFRQAHGIVAGAVRSGDESHSRIVADVIAALGPSAKSTPEQLMGSLDPASFVEVRSIPGGPARAEVAQRLAAFSDALDSAGDWRAARSDSLSRARERLYQAVSFHLS